MVLGAILTFFSDFEAFFWDLCNVFGGIRVFAKQRIREFSHVFFSLISQRISAL